PFFFFFYRQTLFKSLRKAMHNKDFFGKVFSDEEISKAIEVAWNELLATRNDIEVKGEEAIEYYKEHNIHAIVLAGRPYHIDNEVHHGIPNLITTYGFAVLTEDSVAHLGKVERPIIVTDQWTYHTRLYACANFVKKNDFIDMIQLNSFGCGLDAVTTDQVNDILSGSGKIYTLLKIDEVNNIGAARIRIRSLISAINIRKDRTRVINPSNYNRVVFTEKMRKDYTILAPNMSKIHFDILGPALNSCGYNIKILDNTTKNIIDVGLKYVNNDACYPSLIVVGQLMDALLSGKYDLDKTALMITQTGGGCRASNYIGFIRRALHKAHMDQVPVISLNFNGMEKNPGFIYDFEMLKKAAFSVIFGDIFMRVVYATRPYEKNAGDTNRLHAKWQQKCIDFLTSKKVSFKDFTSICSNIVKDFDNIERKDIVKPRVGIVGEILVKFSHLANNNIVELLEKEGAEAVVPDLTDFLLYCFFNNNFKKRYLGGSIKSQILSNIGIYLVEAIRLPARRALKNSKHFTEQSRINKLADRAKKYVSIGNQTGEGWFLTGEMLELIDEGVENIICTQPFGCLPNHIVGKGVIKSLKTDYKNANIVAIDYDPGASEVNQLNRIKLMLATAFANIENKT
ncbi:MAG: 2-hydroxyacyl-CoA dehydratase, partial [Lachnospiraceae bacterium]|nr:2-hydroxyacyl-CoA dehydratase [Lachnospiraceae bacterium]